MKRHTLFIYMATMLTMFGIVLPMSAQNKQKQDALYIYRNDGGFNGFFYGEIDRFEYSKVDTFGVEHDDFVVQEIWARDTVYRIPINAIDSIGFVTPENVYKADVAFTTESDIWNYVIKSDSLTHFVLSANTPSSLIPKVGDKITKTEKTSNLPYGIYGQVVSVDKRADGIAVIFDEIPVGELFDEYTGKFAIRSVPDGDNASSRALIEESWDEVVIETISHEVLNEYDFKEWVRYAGTLNFDKEGNFSVGGDFMVRWKTTSDAYIRKVGFIRSNVIFGEHINLHIEQEVTSDFNFNLDGSVNFNAQLPFNPKVPLPLGSTPLKWYIQGGFFANIAGDLSVKEIEHDKTKSVYDFEYSSPIPLLTTLSLATVPITAPLGLTNAVMSSKLKRDVENLEYRNEFSFNTSSTLKMGIFVKLGIVFWTEEIGELSARGDVGVKVSGTTPRWMDEIKYIPQSLNEIKNPTGNYDNLKNIDYAEDVTPYVAVQASFTAGPPKWNTGVSTPSLERDLTSLKSTYVPIFSDVEVDDLGDSDPNLFARAKVSGPAQNNGVGQEVGFALYNTETNKLVSADYYEKRYTFVDGKQSFTDFSMSIPHKGEKGKLRLYPIVDTNGKYGAMLGTPYRDIDLTQKEEKKDAFDFNNIKSIEVEFETYMSVNGQRRQLRWHFPNTYYNHLVMVPVVEFVGTNSVHIEGSWRDGESYDGKVKIDIDNINDKKNVVITSLTAEDHGARGHTFSYELNASNIPWSDTLFWGKKKFGTVINSYSGKIEELFAGKLDVTEYTMLADEDFWITVRIK